MAIFEQAKHVFEHTPVRNGLISLQHLTTQYCVFLLKIHLFTICTFNIFLALRVTLL